MVEKLALLNIPILYFAYLAVLCAFYYPIRNKIERTVAPHISRPEAAPIDMQVKKLEDLITSMTEAKKRGEIVCHEELITYGPSLLRKYKGTERILYYSTFGLSRFFT